jgi:hypothetical protein
MHANLESMTIIMEISKFFGKDMNLVITYEIFKKIHHNVIPIREKSDRRPYDSKEIRT